MINNLKFLLYLMLITIIVIFLVAMLYNDKDNFTLRFARQPTHRYYSQQNIYNL